MGENGTKNIDVPEPSILHSPLQTPRFIPAEPDTEKLYGLTKRKEDHSSGPIGADERENRGHQETIGAF